MEATGNGAYRTVPLWIKAVVVFHVFASIVWALPRPPKAVQEGKVQPQATLWLLYWNDRYLKSLPPVQSYVLATGTWQYWDMFAPDPASTDWYGTADVTYRDGTTRTVAYPRMVDLPIPVKYVKERYRKFFERAHDANQSRIWPVFAQTMALWATSDPHNPPVVVRLKTHQLLIAGPGERQAKDYTEAIYYQYAVDGQWLQKEVGAR